MTLFLIKKIIMTTTADEKIVNAKDHIDEAYKELLIFLDKGHDDYKEEYIDDVHKIMRKLLKINRKL